MALTWQFASEFSFGFIGVILSSYYHAFSELALCPSRLHLPFLGDLRARDEYFSAYGFAIFSRFLGSPVLQGDFVDRDTFLSGDLRYDGLRPTFVFTTRLFASCPALAHVHFREKFLILIYLAWHSPLLPRYKPSFLFSPSIVWCLSFSKPSL
jgi:hypothetical protein